MSAWARDGKRPPARVRVLAVLKCTLSLPEIEFLHLPPEFIVGVGCSGLLPFLPDVTAHVERLLMLSAPSTVMSLRQSRKNGMEISTPSSSKTREPGGSEPGWEVSFASSTAAKPTSQSSGQT
ncbi:hypothetical protein FB451DRAFT_1193496 [Mycena latifolia]|nr:hypothetical protein FB451DRAFT_1193587 [Mycena latifolia]KAJ7437047.1 hypothetical protein FB451DRAFT_1193496 [Mycena latifolia]